MRKHSIIVFASFVLVASLPAGFEARPAGCASTNMTRAALPVQDKAAVEISNFKFEPKELTVTVGATVEWTNASGRHTVEADNGSFKSPVLTAGAKFEHKFDKAGVYLYHCGFHGEAGGKDMAGKIIVKGAAKK